jgi:hypothetical protein
MSGFRLLNSQRHGLDCRVQFIPVVLEDSVEIFKSRLQILKEQLYAQTSRSQEEIARVISLHEQELVRVESLNQTLQYEAMRERAELKKAHAVELNRVIEENQKLRDDIDRTRLLLNPALQSVELPKERTEPPKPENVPTGTPWQRIQAEHAMRLAREEKDRAERKGTIPVLVPAPVEGDSNGSARVGRNEAS